ncbi:MAG TPA: radical SAM protein [Burkholderiales bacterium]|nr:radical SAM protein [Burkholderiales bacterium]
MNARADIPLPRFVQIEPVGQCNLHCAMCAIDLRKDLPTDGQPAHLSFDDFCRLLDGFSDADELHLQGLGEPLLHPEFFRMVRHAVARGLFVSTNSNLTLLTEERAHECVKSGLGALHISLDAATAEVYENIRRGASFVKVLRNIRRIVQAKRETGSATPELRIVTVVMRANLDQLSALVGLAHELSIDSIFVQHLAHDFGETELPPSYIPMRNFYGTQSLLSADRSLIATAFSAARDRAAELGIRLRLPALEGDAPLRAPGCDWPLRGAYLNYRGDAVPCCMVTADRVNLGNMLAQGVEEVWNGPAYGNFRHALATDLPPQICRTCSLYRSTF